MRVAAVQYKAVKGSFSRSLAALCALARRAAAGTDLLVLPEMAVTGYLFPDLAAAREVAESPDGPTFRAFSEIAGAAGCWLVGGFPELDGESVYNSALVIDPLGELRFVYRKTLLYTADFSWATPGNSGYRIFQTPTGSFGVGICMDLNDDRFTEWLQREQPDAVAFPTNWLDQGYCVWGYWAWRLEGVRSALVAANTWGTEDETGFRGESAILKERTLLAAAAFTGDAVIRAEV